MKCAGGSRFFPEGAASDAEVRSVTRHGDTFRLNNERCSRLSQAEYDSTYNEREQVDTMVDE